MFLFSLNFMNVRLLFCLFLFVFNLELTFADKENLSDFEFKIAFVVLFWVFAAIFFFSQIKTGKGLKPRPTDDDYPVWGE